ncbi:MAG: hypothetical protein HOP35_07425 [Nitrospira sp.]|nr:hypothetical protein [Nitrospira sp.]
MTEILNKMRARDLLLGFLLAVGMFVLMGYKGQDDVVLSNGRYQLAAWGDGVAHGAFVMDTLTGETKIVYRYKNIGNDKFKERDNLNTVFVDIK